MQKRRVRIVNIIIAMLGLFITVYALFPKGIAYSNVGIYAVALFGILLMVNFGFLEFFEFRFRRTIKLILTIIISVAAIVYAVCSLIIFNVPREVTGKGDYTLVILGSKVVGEEPSGMLKNRLDAAYEYLEKNPGVDCIVCGGQGNDEEISEAKVMKNYLVNLGINKNRIYLEENSKSTKENITNAKDIAINEKLSESFIICTDEFHQYRASLFCNEISVSCYALNVKTKPIIVPIYLAREILALCYNFIF